MRWASMIAALAVAAAPARAVAQATGDTLRLSLAGALERALGEGEEVRVARALPGQLAQRQDEHPDVAAATPS